MWMSSAGTWFCDGCLEMKEKRSGGFFCFFLCLLTWIRVWRPQLGGGGFIFQLASVICNGLISHYMVRLTASECSQISLTPPLSAAVLLQLSVRYNKESTLFIFGSCFFFFPLADFFGVRLEQLLLYMFIIVYYFDTGWVVGRATHKSAVIQSDIQDFLLYVYTLSISRVLQLSFIIPFLSDSLFLITHQ